ncbi:unnamed protein product [Porites lobata]|uniref:Uncharacterized protein n=1 Tax=Porites lobata TaxID=104759 RepID=A0ABN8NRS5_9CNID|nr:unnamed protein product [Porites lobata]
MQEFEDETAKDKVLQQLSQQVVKGWPDNVNEVDLKVKPYWSLRDEILVENGYTKELPELYKGKAIYVQDSERKAWSATKVVDQGNSHRSYTLEIETGVHL